MYVAEYVREIPTDRLIVQISDIMSPSLISVCADSGLRAQLGSHSSPFPFSALRFSPEPPPLPVASRGASSAVDPEVLEMPEA